MLRHGSALRQERLPCAPLASPCLASQPWTAYNCGVASSDNAPKRRHVLALDGGGIRGVFSLEILARMEQLLREKTGRPDFVLAEHFDMIAGTSTGAIIAAFLSWGEPVSRIQDFYKTEARRIFVRAPLWRLRRGILDERYLTAFLKGFFVEDDSTAALLGSGRLRTLLLLVMRNASTSSAWPVTNNPAAVFNSRRRSDGAPNPECNLNLPLWQLVRASAAAPAYFPPEVVQLGERRHEFIDGGITAYNNPAFIAFLTATLPQYRIQWPAGPEYLSVVSVGTGQARRPPNPWLRRWFNLLSHALAVPDGLMDAIAREQDVLCRAIGDCVFGASLDAELGDMVKAPAPWPKQFTYVRYNREFTEPEIEGAERQSAGSFGLSDVRLMDFLCATGAEYARNVKLEHFS
jgi:uncharacterized protein